LIERSGNRRGIFHVYPCPCHDRRCDGFTADRIHQRVGVIVLAARRNGQHLRCRGIRSNFQCDLPHLTCGKETFAGRRVNELGSDWGIGKGMLMERAAIPIYGGGTTLGRQRWSAHNSDSYCGR
jgi:hypothetical protein